MTALSRTQINGLGDRLRAGPFTDPDRELLLTYRASFLDALVRRLTEVFVGARVTDRRTQPSHGYRAVHVIPTIDDKQVEVQVRTVMQDFWATVSEGFADEFGAELKYGAVPVGADEYRKMLDWTSNAIRILESDELNDPSSTAPEGIDALSHRLGQVIGIMRLAPRRSELL